MNCSQVTMTSLHLSIAPENGEAIAWLHRHGNVRNSQSDERGITHIDVDLATPEMGALREEVPQPRP